MSPAFRPPGLDAPKHPGTKEQKQVQAMLESMAAQVAEMHPDTMRNLLPVLIDAKKELQKDIAKWLEEHGQDADKRFTAHEYRRVMLNLNESIKAITRIRPELQKVLEAAGIKAGELATEHLAFEVSRMANVFGSPKVWTMVPPQIDTAAIITDAKHELIPRFRGSAARYVGNVRDDIRRQFGVGLARGETFHQLTNRLQRLGGPRGVVSLRGVKGDPGYIAENIAEGLFKRHRYWAERLVRTEVMNAYNVQHAASIDELNEDLDEDEEAFMKLWDGTLDRVCDICKALDGQAVPTDKDFIGPGGLKFKHAPAHPNCRCTVVAWHHTWGSIKGESSAKSMPYGKNKTGLEKAADDVKRKAKEKAAKESKESKEKEAKRAEVAKLKAENEAKRKALAELKARNAAKAKELAALKAKAPVDRPKQLRAAQAEHKAAKYAASPGMKEGEEYRAHRANRTAYIKEHGALAWQDKNQSLDLKRQAAENKGLDPKAKGRLEEAATKERKVRASMTREERTQYTAEMAEKANIRAPKRNRRFDADKDWTEIRREIDAGLQLDGASRRATDKDLDVRIRSIKALGQHFSSGMIEMRPTQLGKAKRFSKAFSTPKKAKAARKAMAEAGDGLQKVKDLTSSMEAQMKVAEAAMDKMPGDGYISADKRREDLKLSKPGEYPMTIRGVPAAEKLADQYWAAERKSDALHKERREFGDALKKHKGIKLMKESEGMSTMVHEAFHEHGPERGNRSAYEGKGKVVEEVTTELSARLAMRKNYGVPQILHDTGGGYGWVIDPLTDKVADTYGVTRAEARDMMDKASTALKQSSKQVSGARGYSELFTNEFPSGGRDAITEELERLVGEI